MLDDRTAANRELDAIGHKIWDNRHNRSGWQAFLGAEPGAEQIAAYAITARRHDLCGLPPAWIGVGDIELFFDEDKTYAERLSSAGVDCTLDIVSGALHGFESVAPDTKLAQAYLSRARDWLGHKTAASSLPASSAEPAPRMGSENISTGEKQEKPWHLAAGAPWDITLQHQRLNWSQRRPDWRRY